MSSIRSYTLPISNYIRNLKESDFALDTKDRVCIYEDNCIVVLLYTESEESKEMLSIFKQVAESSIGVIFGACNVQLERSVGETFYNISRMIDHPFAWTGTRKFPSIIVFRRGYPIWFYEGPPDRQIFSKFINKYANNPQFNIYNFPLLQRIKEDMKIEYEQKHPVVFDGIGSTTGRRPYKLPAVPYSQ